MSRLTHITVMLTMIGDQHRPPPASSWHEHSRAATAPSIWTTCPKCKGEKTLTWKQRPVKCDHRYCRGEGGWYVDPYDQTMQPVATEQNDHVAPAKRITCLECGGHGTYPNSHQCRLCHGAGELILWAADLPEPSNDTTEPTGPGHAMTELVAALEQLHTTDPAAHFAVWYTLILEIQPATQLLLPMRHLTVRGVTSLNTLLPSTWRPPAAVRHRAEQLERTHAERLRRTRGTGRWADPARRAERDTEIRKLHGNGRSVRQIAAHLGIGRSTVSDAITRRPENGRNAA